MGSHQGAKQWSEPWMSHQRWGTYQNGMVAALGRNGAVIYARVTTMARVDSHQPARMRLGLAYMGPLGTTGHQTV